MINYAKAFLLLACAAVASAASIDNSAESSKLLSEAVTLPNGQYTISAANGVPLVYNRALGQAFAPATGSPSAINLEKLDASTMAISMGNNKCISAQWNYTVKADWAGVLYACTVGSTSQNTGLRQAKQHWLFVPVSGGSASAGSAVANLSGATIANSAKTSGLAVSNGANKSSGSAKPKAHHHCKSRKCRSHRARRHRHHHGRRDVDIEKRASSQYYIIAFDHLTDMTTRALTNSVSLTGDGLNVPSWTLNEWQEVRAHSLPAFQGIQRNPQGNSNQIFTVSAA